VETGGLIPGDYFNGLQVISDCTSEHKVYFRQPDRRAVKKTWPGVYGQIRVLGKSGFRNVGMTKGGRFTARLRFQQRRIHVGVYGTPEEASAAAVVKMKELHGQFFRPRENESSRIP